MTSYRTYAILCHVRRTKRRINTGGGRYGKHEYTREDVAKNLGISMQTLRRKLRDGKFDSDEMGKLIDLLEIENPIEIFFAK